MTEAESVRILTKIFKTKDWFSKDEDDSVYDAFFELLQVLSPAERALLLEITERYLWISGSEYDQRIKDALNLIPVSLVENVKTLFLFPIIKLTDVGKSKNGITLVYDIKAMSPKLTKFKHLKVQTVDKFEDFMNGNGTKENEILFLVDDFIGTGETLNQCLSEIGTRMKIDMGKVVIISISCQSETLNRLRSQGLMIYSPNIIYRGISDFNAEPDIELKKDLMKLIEKSIPGAKSVTLGYQESEAVITLKRTPDNTFPIFWKKVRKNGIYLKAPFYRENN